MDADQHDESGEMQRMLRDSAADYVSRTDVSANVRQWRGKAPGFDRARWSEMAELGWLGIRTDEAFGGSGLGMAEAVALLSETGRAIGPEPLSAVAILAARAIAGGDNEAAKTKLLTDLCSGESVIATAWQDKAGMSAPSEIECKANPSGDGFVISGDKDFVHAAAAADIFLIAARAPAGIVLVAVPANASGMSVEHLTFTDGTFFGRLRLSDVAVAADHVIASARVGEYALESALDEARVAASAELVGLSQQALEITLDYLRQRKQFGKAIGSFQGLQHRAVDLHVAISLARAAVDRAVRVMDEGGGPVDRALAAAACKARASDAALQVNREAIQMHGAIGYTDEHIIGLYMRHALVKSAWLGNGGQSRRRYAALAPALELV